MGFFFSSETLAAVRARTMNVIAALHTSLEGSI